MLSETGSLSNATTLVSVAVETLCSATYRNNGSLSSAELFFDCEPAFSLGSDVIGQEGDELSWPTNDTDQSERASGTLGNWQLASMLIKLLALTIIVLTTIVGNLLVLFAVFVNSHLRSTTNYFIVNLAVADLLLGTTVLPFSASLDILGRWDFGPVFCDIWAAVDVLCCTASIIGLCVISVDRYIGVTRPLAYSTIMTEKRALVLIVLVWIVSVTISVGPLFGWREPETEASSCTVTKQIGYVLFSVSGSFYLPTIVILLVYYRIYREAIKQTKFLERGIKTTKAEHNSCGTEVTLRVHTGGSAPGGAGGNLRSNRSADNLAGAGSSPERCNGGSGGRGNVAGGAHGKLAKFKRQKKAAKTLGIVVGVFILCWFPFFFVLPLSALCSSCYVPPELFQVIFWLGYCNSCLNPIIYASSSREFKRAFGRILRCQLRRKPRLLGKDTALGKTCLVTLRSTKASLHHENVRGWRPPTLHFAAADAVPAAAMASPTCTSLPVAVGLPIGLPATALLLHDTGDGLTAVTTSNGALTTSNGNATTLATSNGGFVTVAMSNGGPKATPSPSRNGHAQHHCIDMGDKVA